MAFRWFVIVVVLLNHNGASNVAAGSEETGVKNPLTRDSPRARAVDNDKTGINTQQNTKNGKCTNDITINRFMLSEVEDKIKLSCEAGLLNQYISFERKEILIANPDTVERYSVYGKQPEGNKLQVIDDGECSIRTYSTMSGKTTHSITPVNGAACDTMKKQHLERLQEMLKETPNTKPQKPKPNPKPNPTAWQSAPATNFPTPTWNSYPYGAPYYGPAADYYSQPSYGPFATGYNLQQPPYGPPTAGYNAQPLYAPPYPVANPELSEEASSTPNMDAPFSPLNGPTGTFDPFQGAFYNQNLWPQVYNPYPPPPIPLFSSPLLQFTPFFPNLDGNDFSDNSLYSTTISVEKTDKDGKCIREVTIKSKTKPGFEDTIEFSCTAGSMSSFISSQKGDVLVFNPKTIESNSVYGNVKTPNKLQVIKDNECYIRTYTRSGDKTLPTSMKLPKPECDTMKKEHLERFRKWNDK